VDDSVRAVIRRIRRDEGLRLRALRLSALADSPMAFGSTLAQEEGFPEHVWHERAAYGAAGSDRVTFVAERDSEWIGLATGLAHNPDDPNDPRPVLVGMFVTPAVRGRGVGVALVEAVVAWARERQATALCLWVTSTNRCATSRLMAQRPAKKPKRQLDLPTPAPTTTTPVLPMQLQIGDRFTDEEGEWEIATRPWTTHGGKMIHASVQTPGDPRPAEKVHGLPTTHCERLSR